MTISKSLPDFRPRGHGFDPDRGVAA